MLNFLDLKVVFTLRHGGHVGTHLQKNFNELILLCAPTRLPWPLSFGSHRTEGHVSENHLYRTIHPHTNLVILNGQYMNCVLGMPVFKLKLTAPEKSVRFVG